MNLLYDQKDNGLNNFQQYNGNISAVKWSNNLSLGTTKNFAYNYAYDTLNRIKSANYLCNPGVWTASTKFAENGFKYDLNGNIKALRRTDGNMKTIDSLIYDYSNNGNQLRSVTDGRDIINGFFDGNITGDDYTYDVNGNMIVDKNKSITAIAYNHLNLPQKVTKGTGESIVYTYDAGGRKLTQKVYNTSNILTKATDYLGEYIYQNDTLQFVNHEEGRIVTKGVATPEYQFHLKDHLGNVRTTFTTARNVDTPVATFETANQTLEQSQFLRYDDARMINSTLFDHTHNGVTAYSERLSGSANEKTGIARSISVMPGDTVNLSVYAKWVDPNNSNNTSALTQMLGQIVAGTAAAGTVIDGANYSVNGITPFPYTGMAGEGSSTGTGPKAFMNYLIFDRNFVFVNGGYVRMTTDGKEDGTNVAHQLLSAQVIITQPGYLYTHLSNEESSPKEVYFDDFKVQQIKSPVVQQEDFYPFGLTFNSFTRENAVPQNYLYQSKELIKDLSLNLDDFEARVYDPAIGRTGAHDPHEETYYGFSAYSWVMNNPVSLVDPSGMDAEAPDLKGGNKSDDWQSQYEDSKKYRESIGSEVIATCPTCPGGKEYDQYRDAPNAFAYDENSKVVYNDVKGLSNTSSHTEGDPEEEEVTFDARAAAKYMIAKSTYYSNSDCSTAVMKGLRTGGFKNFPNAYGGDFGPNLQAVNFTKITDIKSYQPQVGDVTVWSRNSAHKSGHVQMYGGDYWVSDWHQDWATQPPAYQKIGGSGFVPYAKDVPSYAIYRYSGPIIK